MLHRQLCIPEQTLQKTIYFETIAFRIRSGAIVRKRSYTYNGGNFRGVWFYMKKVLELSRYLVLIAVITTLLASLATFCVGVYKAGVVVWDIVNGGEISSVGFLHIMDTFLIAVVLLLFSTGLYSLFIKDFSFSSSLKIGSIDELEIKLGNLIVLVMALNLLEHFIHWENSDEMLYMAIVFVLVSSGIIAHGFLLTKKKSRSKLEQHLEQRIAEKGDAS